VVVNAAIVGLAPGFFSMLNSIVCETDSRPEVETRLKPEVTSFVFSSVYFQFNAHSLWKENCFFSYNEKTKF
jgi:hypothetical protein